MIGGRCADLSEEAGESLAATATSVDTWLLVEVRGIAYVLMRERDLHAVAADRFEGSEDSTGLYL